MTNYKLSPDDLDDKFESKKYNMCAEDESMRDASLPALFEKIIPQIESDLAEEQRSKMGGRMRDQVFKADDDTSPMQILKSIEMTKFQRASKKAAKEESKAQ